MKHPMRALLAASSAVGLFISGTAWAGSVNEGNTYVYIDNGTGSGIFMGDLGFAHNSGDRTQYIACYSYGRTGGCYAADPAGNAAYCVTSNPDMLATIRSVTGDSRVVVWFSAGFCTNVEVITSSMNSPKR
jgi:hypothetical protein